MLWNFLWPCKLLSLPSLTTQQKSEVVSTLGKPWGSDFDWSLNCLSPVANTAFGSFFNTLEKILDVFMFHCPSRLSARGLLALPAGGWLNRGGHQERSAVTLPCSVMIVCCFLWILRSYKTQPVQTIFEKVFVGFAIQELGVQHCLESWLAAALWSNLSRVRVW